MASKYGSMTITELKDELRKRNARLSGRKNELVDRLVAYDRNANFGQPEKLEPEYCMQLPSASCYQDVNSDSKFLGTNIDELQNYLQQFQKTLEPHIETLYDERFINYFRLANSDNLTFIKASCHAEMKKGVSYTVDISLNGCAISEAQCECAAGMGPTAHCKHVCTVLFGAVMFERKKCIKTEETCTQKLQSFHKTKKFHGSPVKLSSLDLQGADEFTNVDFDPRPMHLRDDPGYEDHFRNACLNFPGISSMPIFQIFEPANAFAVAHDHDYLEKTPEDNFLEKMQVTKITEEQIISLERKTIGQHLNTKWKEERAKRLTSSMFGKICKSTNRTDKQKLAMSLTKVSGTIKVMPLEHGRKHEETAIQYFMKDTGKVVKRCGLKVSNKYSFLASSPDGIIDRHTIVEVKCPYSARDKQITCSSVPYLKTCETGGFCLDQNHDYYYQIQGQLLCTNAKVCILIVCTASSLKVNDIKYMNVERNDQFISKMVSQLESFFDVFFKEALLEKHFYKSLY